MDWEIEKRENKSVKEIFSQHGEDYFRQVEAAVLREWAVSQDNFVMGTGGGAPCFFQGMDVINKAGLSIFLDVPVAELKSRLAAATDRPLLNANDEEDRESKLNLLRELRLPIYNQAHVIVENADLEKLLKALHFKK